MFMPTKCKNPNQLELFEKMTNRKTLPIDSGEFSKEPLPPGIASAIASVKRHLDDFNATPKVSDPESPLDDR